MRNEYFSSAKVSINYPINVLQRYVTRAALMLSVKSFDACVVVWSLDSALNHDATSLLAWLICEVHPWIRAVFGIYYLAYKKEYRYDMDQTALS